MMVVLGELGGRDEYSLVEALKQGKVQKPVVAWVSGTCARLFKSEVQFGHAVRHYSHCFLFIFYSEV
jgi:ATP citrate (pro-S)-lyase